MARKKAKPKIKQVSTGNRGQIAGRDIVNTVNVAVIVGYFVKSLKE